MWHLLTLYLLPLFPFLGLLWSPCCCTQCEIFSDDFATDDISNYTQVAGSWSISGGVLSIASSNAVLTGNTANPTDANTAVNVGVNIATSGDTARIIVNYQNSSNYWFAEVKAGTGAYLKIYQRSGGSNTQKESINITLATGSFGFCAAIANGSEFTTAVTTGGAAIASLHHGDTFTQTGWGLGTGTRTGTVTFDNLDVTEVSTNCSSGCTFSTDCPNFCINNAYPAQFQAEIADLHAGTAGSFLCSSPTYESECTNSDRIEILDYHSTNSGASDGNGGTYCETSYQSPDTPYRANCPGHSGTAVPDVLYLREWSVTGSFPAGTRYFEYRTDNTLDWTWIYHQTTIVDCLHLAALQFPNADAQSGSSPPTCDISSATFFLSALS